MSEFVNTIDLLGDEAVTKALVERTITEFHDNVVSAVGHRAFQTCSALVGINFPNVINVGKSAFYGCKSLTIPNLPNVTTLGEFAFCQCNSLTSVDFPNVTSIGSSAFEDCSKLTSVDIPLATRINSSAFDGCSALEKIDLPSVTRIDASAFAGCSKLGTVILRSSNICTLANKSAFNYTPFASGRAGGTLLVPRSLVESCKTATNWSVIWGYGHNRFLALEDYTVDGTITGEIDWDKLNGGTT